MIDFACQRFDLNEIIKCSLNLSRADYKLMLYFLDKVDEWLSTAKISKDLNLNLSTIQRCVKTLHEKNILKRAQENLSGGGYIFTYTIENKNKLRQKIKQIVNNWNKTVNTALESW